MGCFGTEKQFDIDFDPDFDFDFDGYRGNFFDLEQRPKWIDHAAVLISLAPYGREAQR